MRKLAIGPLVRLIASLVAFVLGVYGFAAVYEPHGVSSGAHLFDYAFKSLQLVVGQFPDELNGKPLPWPLHIARWALPMLAGWTTVSLAWVQVRNRLRLKWVAMRGDHLVIAGDTGLAARVARAERAAKRPVILWTDETRERWVQDAAEDGAPHVSFKDADRGLADLGLERARSLLLAGPDDALNVSLATAALEHALKVRTPGDPLNVIARVDDIDLRAPLEDRLNGVGYRAAARLRFASVPDITARDFFLRQSLDRFTRADGVGRLVFFLGFSPIAERLVLRLMVAAHFRDGVSARLVALDPDADRRRQIFFARHSGAESLAPIAFETAPIDQPSLVPEALAEAIERHGAPTLIVIDPADPGRALSIALAVAAYFRKRGEISPPIHVHMASEANAGIANSVFAFGGPDRLATPERLLQEKSDALARSVHDFYYEGQLAEGVQIGSRSSMYDWDSLPEAMRDDNRLVADCYLLKLRDIGARLVPGGGDGLRFEGDELESLARAEHERWMASKLIDGWVYGEKRDDAAKHHPNIVGYDALSEPIKDLDRQQIRIMARLVGQTGRHAVRDLMVAVDYAPGEAMNARAGAASAMAELTRRYPGRAIVLLGAFEDAAVRDFLISGVEAGAFVQLTLERDAEDTLDGLSGPGRSAASHLFREADRLFALPAAGCTPAQRRDFQLARAQVRIAGAGSAASDLPTVRLNAAGAISGES